MSQSMPTNPTPTGDSPEANRVRIFDTTLRDGEQSPAPA